MSEYRFYQVEKKPPLAFVSLNRPHKKNAMNAPAWRETLPIFEDLDADDDIRVIILSGAGQCFSAGIDLLAMAGDLTELSDPHQKGGVKQSLVKKIMKLQDGLSCIEWCRKPVIAAVHGHCIGAGLDMISACDIRLCSQDAVFCLKEAAVGIVADVGVLQRLPHIIGQGMTRELAYTAQNIDAARAKDMMLVNHVYSDHETLMQEAEKIGTTIAENSPLAVQSSKSVLNFGIGKTIADNLDYVARVSANTMPSDDLMEAMTAFMEKRKPVFTGK
ncbi:crotonase/enoyl-CoA hydratase family protein [Desulfobacterales bacterium HSG17]|nr:crotonase/enoyl-CoA hydratase family protein [Desulfobacterales bacterium HSG17]